LGDVTIRKIIFICVKIEKKSPEPADQFQSNWHKSFLGTGDSKLFKLRARSSSKGR
jgi:hypothetical protein